MPASIVAFLPSFHLVFLSHSLSLSLSLILKLFPSNLLLCTVTSEKGTDENMVTRLAQFIKESGYSHIAYRSDQEASIRALFEAALAECSRHGQIQMVPEASSVGENRSNGKAASAVKMVEEKAARTNQR